MANWLCSVLKWKYIWKNWNPGSRRFLERVNSSNLNRATEMRLEVHGRARTRRSRVCKIERTAILITPRISGLLAIYGLRWWKYLSRNYWQAGPYWKKQPKGEALAGHLVCFDWTIIKLKPTGAKVEKTAFHHLLISFFCMWIGWFGVSHLLDGTLILKISVVLPSSVRTNHIRRIPNLVKNVLRVSSSEQKLLHLCSPVKYDQKRLQVLLFPKIPY